MEHISETEKLIIQTLASYVLMGELEQNRIVDKEIWKNHYEELSEIQKEKVAVFETEKKYIGENSKEHKNQISFNKGGDNRDDYYISNLYHCCNYSCSIYWHLGKRKN